MIARTWRAAATRDGAEQYEVHFRDAVLPELRSLRGFRRALLMRRGDGDRVEIEVLTLWESREAVVEFAGAAMDLAVVEPAAQAVLLEYDKTVNHNDAIEFTGER
jgi:heme-degrading monooxygenase HmoA